MIVASIDLMEGKAVQLRRGKEKMLEHSQPLKLAEEFDKYGEIAVIDLDAAMEKGENKEIIKNILKIAECRVGGGIRSVEKAKEMISLGAKKVIIGSKAFENDKINKTFLKELKKKVGKGKIIIAIDALNEIIVTRGWKHSTGISLYKAIKDLEEFASEFLFTCVEKEGTLKGINLEIVKKLLKETKNKVTVAGGVSTIEEIKELANLGCDVQLGMALYTGKISLKDGFIESLNWKTDLLPTITQDDEGQVLMLAYSNKDSLRKTFETGNMCYFSRSRGKLWMKGETSGNIQKLLKIRADCDRDTLLATVQQKGVACHLETYTCFGEKNFNLKELYKIIKDKIRDPKNRVSYEDLNKELLEGKDKEEIKLKAANLLYLATFALAKSNISFDEVLSELRRYRK
ncbi:MAG: phosphoribosyl-AMP cyclohydrolase [candidate division WOR-3 bacterium]